MILSLNAIDGLKMSLAALAIARRTEFRSRKFWTISSGKTANTAKCNGVRVYDCQLRHGIGQINSRLKTASRRSPF